MPRKALIISENLPYHVTARANNREAFHLPLEKIWQIFNDECLFLSIVYEVEFHSMVLMHNHVHLLLTVPKYDLGKVMNVFVSSATRTMNRLSGRSGHVFGGPYHWSMICDSRYFGHAFKYVYRNPVRAKISQTVEDYPYSTLHGLLGNAHLPFPIHLTRVGMELALPSSDPLEQLAWLNQPFPKEAEELIQKGLRKKLFDVSVSRKDRRPLEAMNQLL